MSTSFRKTRALAARLVLPILGAALGLLLVEGALRIAASRLARAEAKGLTHGPEGAPVRILCLGESTTAPVFAHGEDFSWPAQLEALLAKAHPGVFRIINAGVNGTNCSIIRARLPSLLERYRPAVVIAMTGFNDTQWYGIPAQDGGWLGQSLRAARTYRLVEYLGHDLPLRLARSRRSKEAAAALPPPVADCYGRVFPSVEDEMGIVGEPRSDMALCRDAAARYPAYHQTYDAMAAIVSRRINDPRLALDLAAEAVKRGSQERISLMLYGYHELFAGHPEAAEAAFRRDVEAYPEMERTYLHLISFLVRKKRLREADAFFQKMLAVDGDAPEGRFEVRPVPSGREGVALVSAAFRRVIAAEAGRSGAAVVAMQYPGEPVRALEGSLRGIPGVVFVDNKPSFDAALKKAPYDRYFCDRFAGAWGHCTEAGNRIIAENAAAVVEGLLRGRLRGSGQGLPR